jgi:hypothetical protein
MYSLKNYENIYLSVFMIFQSSMGIGKSRCDVPNGITQGWAYLNLIILFFELNMNEFN